LIFSPAAFASDPHDISSFRCEGAIIGLGDMKYEVLEICGEPTYEEELAYGNELWIYDFGSGSFNYYLTFRGIKLRRIQTGGD